MTSIKLRSNIKQKRFSLVNVIRYTLWTIFLVISRKEIQKVVKTNKLKNKKKQKRNQGSGINVLYL